MNKRVRGSEWWVVLWVYGPSPGWLGRRMVRRRGACMQEPYLPKTTSESKKNRL